MHGNMRTFLLMAAMTALLMGMGWLIGGQGGAVLALVVVALGVAPGLVLAVTDPALGAAVTR